MSTASKQRTSTVKVGVLTLVSITLLVVCLIWLRGRNLNSGKPIAVLFEDVNGMKEGAPVQMMGIRVGFIDDIKPIRNPKSGKYYVKVTFSLNKDLSVKVPRGSTLSIEQSGLIGEQFMEITPPQQREVTLATFKEPAQAIHDGIPVKFLYEEGYVQVGTVEKAISQKDGNLVRHRLFYRITLPGAHMPDDPLFELTLGRDGQYYLRVLPKEPLVAQAPDKGLYYTVEEPMRLKRFLEIQMDSAEALKLTNDKINQLLSDETIDSLHSTVKNTEVLTARANEVMDTANRLFQTTRQDLDQLVGVSEQLAQNVSDVSKNINDIIGNPKLKGEMTSTIASLRESSDSMRALLNDPALKDTIQNTRETSRNANQLMTTLRQTAQDKDLQNRLDRITVELDHSLARLNSVLGNVDELTDDKDQNLRGIIEDTRETAKNMKQLSKKFNGHFTLFKLLF